MTPKESYSPGLEGAIAGETAVSTVVGGLSYRGYSVVELAEHCSFEEVAYLLLHGDLPKKAELSAFRDRLREDQELPPLVVDTIRKIPKTASAMDALRSAVSLLAHFDPDLEDASRAGNLRKAERLLARIPLVIGHLWRTRQGQTPVAPHPGLGFAAQMLYLLDGKAPSDFAARAFDVSLILYAEHEFNASTFTARVICSTEADLYSGIVGAIGALKGRLHGGANEKVMDLLLATGGPEQAEAWIRGALVRKEKIMGFGHRVYKTGDVRAGVLKTWAERAAAQTGQEQWEKTAAILEAVMAAEKNLHPNLDWPAGRLYHALGLDVSLYTPFFVASRVTGWAAHIIEQTERNRIMRPRGLYTGPENRVVRALKDRG